ncbi:hypothetical protein HX849_04690 [Marine Group I thaumarchaeote]|nr:hypothetical protein [Marine Group I thaumarchaeote]
MKIIKLNLKGILGIITLCMASLLVGVAYADEPIKITISSSIDRVQFDGEWTFRSEWKHSSYDKFWYDKGTALGSYSLTYCTPGQIFLCLHRLFVRLYK